MQARLLESPRGRRWFFAVLYASEGAPMGFIWWALPTLLAREGVPLVTITALTSTVTLPWILKFLAGPLVDASSIRGVSLRTWILVCQSAMLLTMLATAFIDWPSQIGWLTAVLVAHAISAATQDVAIDTLAIRIMPPEELGRVNGWMQAGMLLGRAVVAGASVSLAARFGPGGPIALVVLVIAVPMVLLVRTHVRAPAAYSSIPGLREWFGAFSPRNVLLGLGIAVTAGAGFEFLAVAIGPLLVEWGAGDGISSTFFGLVAPAGLIVGALLGGQATDRIHAARGTTLGVLAIALFAGVLGALLMRGYQPDLRVLVAAFGVFYVAIGFFTAASYALLMQLARGPLSATRFAVFMALTNACEAWSGFAGGRLHGMFGYGVAFLVLVSLSLVALPLLSRLRVSNETSDMAAGQRL